MSKKARDTARKEYHTLRLDEVLESLGVDPERGLGEEEAKARLRTCGANRLESGAGNRPLLILARQFTNLMIIVLVVAAVIAGLIGEAFDALAILVIVLLNGIIGFVQEYRAERALQALQQLSAPLASRMVTDGCQAHLPH